jgi:hypothetical protein
MQASGAQIFQKSRHQLQILGFRRVTQSRFHNEDSQIPRATVRMYSPHACTPGGGYIALGGKTPLHPRRALILILHFTGFCCTCFFRRSDHICKQELCLTNEFQKAQLRHEVNTQAEGVPSLSRFTLYFRFKFF